MTAMMSLVHEVRAALAEEQVNWTYSVDAFQRSDADWIRFCWLNRILLYCLELSRVYCRAGCSAFSVNWHSSSTFAHFST